MVSLLYPPKWYLGNRRGHKGHEDFIIALAKLRKERPDVRGIMIGGTWGDGRWYEDRVRRFGKKTCGDALAFTGTRTDLPTNIPIWIWPFVPTHSDGLAYSVVEPLLAGVPVVATDVGGIPELIRDGETGWLVHAGNPDALAQAVSQALSNPKEAQRRTARGAEAARELLDLKKPAMSLLPFTKRFSNQQGNPECTPQESRVPLNRLRKLLFDEYEAHYLRLNALTSDSLNEVSYKERMPDYEASYGRIVSGLPKGSRILDAGCGIGFLLFWLQRADRSILSLLV